ncbi:MAG: peptidase inhibitor family I36 protein [Acidobacteriota bacterium]
MVSSRNRRGFGAWFWVALSVCAVLLAAVPAAAQGADQVFVYQHGNYGGALMRFDHNQEVADLRSYNTGGTGSPSWNDQISSLKVGVNKKLLLYEHINFQGAMLVVQYDACKSNSNTWAGMPSGWNDRVSSFKVVDADNPPAQPPDASGNQVYVYEDKNYGGNYMRFDHDTDVGDLRSYNTGTQGSPTWNDRVTSIVVGSGMKITFWADINYKGSSFTLTGPSTIACLSPSGWNDKISSFKIRYQ